MEDPNRREPKGEGRKRGSGGRGRGKAREPRVDNRDNEGGRGNQDGRDPRDSRGEGRRGSSRKRGGRELWDPVSSSGRDRDGRSGPRDTYALLITGEEPLDFEAVIEWCETCGPIKSVHYQDPQTFGFVVFADEDSLNVALETTFVEIDEKVLQVQRCRRVTPGRDPRESSREATPEPAELLEPLEPSETLVVKNLPYSAKAETLGEFLEKRFKIPPESVELHFDGMGQFRGVAFVHYATVEDAQKMMPLLSGFDYGGRRLRIEYKRISKQAREMKARLARERDKEIPQSEEEERAEVMRIQEILVNFHNNPSKPEYSFPKEYTSWQRRQIHIVAEKLQLFHYSIGEGIERYIIVSKTPRDDLEASGSSGRGLKASKKRDKEREKEILFGRLNTSSLGYKAGRNPQETSSNKKEPQIMPIRAPNGPDGTNGFSAEYQARRASLNLTEAEVSIIEHLRRKAEVVEVKEGEGVITVQDAPQAEESLHQYVDQPTEPASSNVCEIADDHQKEVGE